MFVLEATLLVELREILPEDKERRVEKIVQNKRRGEVRPEERREEERREERGHQGSIS